MVALWGPAHLEAKNVALPANHPAPCANRTTRSGNQGVQILGSPTQQPPKEQNSLEEVSTFIQTLFLLPFEAGWIELLWRACGVSL